MNNEVTLIIRKERMEEIFQKIPRNKWSYFHKKSFENFICYLPNLKGEAQRADTEAIIDSYLDSIDCEYDDFDEINMDLSLQLYKTYFLKLVQPFELNLGFVPIYPRKALIIILPVLALIFYLSRNNGYILTILSIFLILYIGRIFLRAFHGKLYGFGY